MNARLAWVFVAGVLLGAGGMWLGLSRAPAPAVAPQGMETRPAPPRAPEPSVDIAEIRAVVRQELLAAAAASSARALPEPPAAVAATPPPEPPEQVVREAPRPKQRTGREYSDAQRLVEGSLMRRTWSVEDRGQLQALLPLLSPTERESLTRQLIVAANRGELKVDVAGPLF